MKIAIVTDSTADIPAEIARETQIHVVPNIVVIEGQSYRDGEDITRREFYERLPDMKDHPTTATASSGTYLQLYKLLFQQGAQNILSIHVSGLLSGVCNAARVAAQEFGDRVRIIDSEQLTLGLGFQALSAAEAVKQGSSIGNILEMLQDIRERVHVIAMLDTLEYVRRSGRVSWARARLGNLLQVKSFIEVRDGQVFSLGKTRTRRKGIEKMLQYLRDLGPLDQLAILHSNAESDARRLLMEFNPDLKTDPLVVNVTTAIGIHVGPNGLGFAAVVS
jgi:DegV family protein with EDD domain